MDEFALRLLEESKRFLELASASTDVDAKTAYCHAALMLSFCALEAHVNAVADDFADRGDLSVHDKGILLEKEVSLDDGVFLLTNKLKIYRLEDRIKFLHQRFATRPVDERAAWRGKLSSAIWLRNQLTHPKAEPNITIPMISQAIEAIVEAIDQLYMALYKKPFPAAVQGLQSSLEFGEAE